MKNTNKALIFVFISSFNFLFAVSDVLLFERFPDQRQIEYNKRFDVDEFSPSIRRQDDDILKRQNLDDENRFERFEERFDERRIESSDRYDDRRERFEERIDERITERSDRYDDRRERFEERFDQRNVERSDRFSDDREEIREQRRYRDEDDRRIDEVDQDRRRERMESDRRRETESDDRINMDRRSRERSNDRIRYDQNRRRESCERIDNDETRTVEPRFDRREREEMINFEQRNENNLNRWSEHWRMDQFLKQGTTNPTTNFLSNSVPILLGFLATYKFFKNN
ncbi:hypothetical protein DERP_008224 [Dermatophagoides pteronyssinus]|uniref:Uncharacterized protein n=1 Tax=Dermatophagoides pteronyssinus TaxID=6956 RepID=A0ABQ8J6J6_DERPT|nr:hypothetical protein DERP_008224 [Dermatophagoides pteronyssinus]